MDRLRQGVFSSLGARIEGLRFLDLFAGTGSYGLEALSRGAVGGTFVEQDRQTLQALRTNVTSVCRSLGSSEASVHPIMADALTWTPPEGEVFDLIFCDPPFDDIPRIAESLFRRIAGFMCGDPPGMLIFEMPGQLELSSPGWRFVKRIGQGRDQPTCCFYVPERS